MGGLRTGKGRQSLAAVVMSDNGYYVNLAIRLEQSLNVVAEPAQRLQPLGCGLDDLGLRLEDPLSFPFRQHAHDFAHLPPRRAEHLQSVCAWHQQRDTVVANDSNALRITIECL